MSENLIIEDKDLIYKLHTFVPALVEVDESWEALKNRYPQMLADLTSAKYNSNCSCRTRVGSFLNEKYQSSKEEKDFILKLFSIPALIEKSTPIIKDTKERENAYKNFPRIHTVKKGDDSWADFVKFLEKNHFDPRAFSVLDNNNGTITVYLM
jgi:hypothetical protein